MIKIRLFLCILTSLTLLWVNQSIAGMLECEKAFESQNYDLALKECNQTNLYDELQARYIVALIFENGYGSTLKSESISCGEYVDLGKLGYCDAHLKVASCQRKRIKPSTDQWTARDYEALAEKEDKKYIVCNSKLKAEEPTIGGINEALEEPIILDLKPEPEPEPTDVDVGWNLNECSINFDQKRYKEAFRTCKSLADSGQKNSQFYIGSMYKTGKGVEQSDYKAIDWLTLAANQGVNEASYELGNLYYYHPNQYKSFSKAKKWFLKAARNGHDKAQYKLGVIYYYGYTPPQDLDLAIYWLTKSADQGNNLALNLLKSITLVEPSPPTPTPEIVTEPTPLTPTPEQTKKKS